MDKLYEVITATYDEKEKEYAARMRSVNVIGQTAEDVIQKAKATLMDEKGVIEFIDEVKIIASIDIK